MEDVPGKLQREDGVGVGVRPADIDIGATVPVDRDLEEQSLSPWGKGKGGNNTARFAIKMGVKFTPELDTNLSLANMMQDLDGFRRARKGVSLGGTGARSGDKSVGGWSRQQTLS